MKKVGIPFDLSLINDDIELDMSSLNFPTKNQIRSSFLFIRNSGNKIPLNFDNCTYQEKEDFLIKYLTENICIDVDILISTWLMILFKNFSMKNSYNSILSPEEIELFYKKNNILINQIYQIIISFPVCAIYSYHDYLKEKNNGINITMDFECTDFDDINIYNLINLLNYKDEIFVLINNLIKLDNMKPLMYTKYFMDNQLNYIITHKLPYLSFLNLFFGSDDERNNFIEKLEKIVNEYRGDE